MRKLLIGIAVLVVVLVAAVLVVPGLIDWNGYKPEIQAAVKQATGRDLRLEGDIGLSVLPSPSLSVEKVAFANLEGGSVPDMARLESLRVHVALLPLLTGNVHVTSVTLVEPTIVLERLADGRANWEMAPAGAAPATPGAGGEDSGGAGGAPAFALDSATIEGGSVLFRDVAGGTEHRVDAVNMVVSAGGLEGPFEADGSFNYQGLPMTLDASVGRLGAQQSTSIRAVVTAADRALTATVSGSLDGSGPSFKGEAKVEAPDLGKAVDQLAAALGSAPTSPVGPGQPFSVTTAIDGSPSAINLNDLTIALADSRIQGSVAVGLSEVPTVDAKLSGNRLDLDALLPGTAREAGAGGSATPGTGGPASVPSETFAMPAGIGGSVDIAIDAVQFRGASIRAVRLAGDLVDGAANLRLATAQLPGGTELTVTGTVVSNGVEPTFAGRVEAVSDNLRATLNWAGVDTAAVAPDRLRKASIQAAVTATPRQVEVTDWTMELDATKAKGGLTLVVRERPAFGLSLEVDRINIDAYLPPPAVAQPGAASSPGAGDAGGTVPAGGDNPLAALTAVDANVNIKIGEATAFGVPVRDARIDALLQNGTLTLRDVGVADLGGARASVAGVLRDAAGKPSVDMTFDITVVNVDRFAKLLSTESPIAAKQLGQVALKGSASGDMQDVKVDVRLTAAGGNLGVKGTAKPLATPPRLDLALSMAHPDANKLVAALAPGALDGAGPLGALNGEGAIGTRDDGRYTLRLGLTVAGGSIGLVGNADAFAAIPAVDMAVEATHPDAVRLARTFAPTYRPAGSNLGAFKARTRFQGPVDNVRLFETELGAGAIRATGEGKVDARGDRPAVTLALAVNKVEVDPWLPPSAPKPAGAVPAAPVPAGAAAPGREWSRERIDTSGLSTLNAELSATIASIVYGSYVVDNANLDVRLKDGVLDVSRLAGGMFGGSFDLNAQIADRPTPTAALVVKVRDADVRKAAKTAAATDTVSGILTYDTNLQTRGVSEFDLVSALSGAGSFSVRDGVVEGFDIQAFSDQLKSLDRAPDFVQLAQRSLSGGETRFTSLSGTYTVAKGVLRSTDIALQADAAVGTATAVVDLPPQQMDMVSSFRLSEHPNSPPVGLRLVGPLDNPRRILDIEAMQAHILQRLVERGLLKQLDKGGNVQELLRGFGGGQAPAPTAPTAPAPAPDPGAAPQPTEPVKPEDAVRGLLRGLIKPN